MSGPYIFALLGNCIDAEDGAMTFELPPSMTLDKYRQINCNPMMGMAPELTWVNVEHEKARYKIFEGMNTRMHAMPADPPVPVDAHAGVMQFEPRAMLRMIRTTSTISCPGANFSWMNMRKHGRHGHGMRASTCQQ